MDAAVDTDRVLMRVVATCCVGTLAEEEEEEDEEVEEVGEGGLDMLGVVYV